MYLHRPPVLGTVWQYFLAKSRALPLPIASPYSVSSCNSHADAANGSVGRGVAGAPNGRTVKVLSEHSAAPPPLASRQNVWGRLVGSRAADLSASCVTVAKQPSRWCRRCARADVHKQLRGGMSGRSRACLTTLPPHHVRQDYLRRSAPATAGLCYSRHQNQGKKRLSGGGLARRDGIHGVEDTGPPADVLPDVACRPPLAPRPRCWRRPARGLLAEIRRQLRPTAPLACREHGFKQREHAQGDAAASAPTRWAASRAACGSRVTRGRLTARQVRQKLEHEGSAGSTDRQKGRGRDLNPPTASPKQLTEPPARLPYAPRPAQVPLGCIMDGGWSGARFAATRGPRHRSERAAAGHPFSGYLPYSADL